MKELKKCSQISERTKTQETPKRPLTAHEKIKRVASLDNSIARHNRRGYQNRKMEALGYPSPYKALKAKRKVKLLKQIFTQREKNLKEQIDDKSKPNF